jgi:hypothetical protein
MTDKIIECDPNDEGADCENCPNTCSWIDDCEYCVCPMECPSFKRSNLRTIGRLSSRGFDPYDN